MCGRDVCPPPPEVIPPLRQRLSLGHVLREYGVVRAPHQPLVFVAQRREDEIVAVSPVFILGHAPVDISSQIFPSQYHAPAPHVLRPLPLRESHEQHHVVHRGVLGGGSPHKTKSFRKSTRLHSNELHSNLSFILW